MLARNCDLYFGVLRLDVAVLPGELLGLVLQVRVGALQLFLLSLQLHRTGLQLGGQPLRLVQQGVGPRVGHDRVDVDAERLGELLQEVGLHRSERRERGQLDDAQHLALEQDRQHGQVGRRRLAQPRVDLDVTLG
jgi:hypothetical protein